MIGGGGRGERGVAVERRLDDIGALHRARDVWMRGRGNPGRVDGLHLFDVAKDIGKLAGEQVRFVVGERQPGEARHALDFGTRETIRHAQDAIKGSAPWNPEEHLMIRPAAMAGTWYPATPAVLLQDLEGYLGAAGEGPSGRVDAVIVPHAGLMFSGAVGAWAFKAAARHPYDVVVLVGPSHHVGFSGVALWPEGAFASPLGDVVIDPDGANAMLRSSVVRSMPSAHEREHSLEMQVPFVARLLPGVPIVPLLMGAQRRETIEALAEALTAGFAARRALLVASTDLSHFFDAETAATLDGRVQDAVARFDPEGLLGIFEHYPEHERGRYVACGGGPAISVLLAARALGARDGRVLKYAHSGDVSGDHSCVVGYLAAAFGTFDDAD